MPEQEFQHPEPMCPFDVDGKPIRKGSVVKHSGILRTIKDIYPVSSGHKYNWYIVFSNGTCGSFWHEINIMPAFKVVG